MDAVQEKEDLAMVDVPAGDNTAELPPKVRLNDYRKNPTMTRVCIKTPEWTYIKVKLISTPPTSAQVDLLTWKSRLLAAQTRYLGLVGSAIDVDILHLEGEHGDTALLRVPREDASAFASAVGDWTAEAGGKTLGFRLLRMTNFMHGIADTRENELFH